MVAATPRSGIPTDERASTASSATTAFDTPCLERHRKVHCTIPLERVSTHRTPTAAPESGGLGAARDTHSIRQPTGEGGRAKQLVSRGSLGPTWDETATYSGIPKADGGGGGEESGREVEREEWEGERHRHDGLREKVKVCLLLEKAKIIKRSKQNCQSVC